MRTLKKLAPLVVLLLMGIGPSSAATPEKGVFLVATEKLDGTSFEKTVILVTHAERTGTLGIAVNRDSGRDVSEFFTGLSSAPLFLGGPVRPDALFVIAKNPATARRSLIVNDLYLLAGADARSYLTDKSNTHGRSEVKVFSGFTGWAPGQLEAEIGRGDWESVRADSQIVFQKDIAAIWPVLLQLARARWI